MSEYHPPFSVSNSMIFRVSSISEKLGRISGCRTFDAKPHLRRNNRIRSIYSSLAIEANSLSLDEVRGVIDGKTVIGPQREIQEVLNAYQAYEKIGVFDPFSLRDLNRLHGVMTFCTVRESGCFRSGEEGVFDGDRCIFMAPPARHVPELMQQLFEWMHSERDTLHPLIMSSVFHYEFVFIHPFADGNGRMARLWQTAILYAWNPIFRDLPLESRIFDYQEEYYAAISQCHVQGASDLFIEFMLRMIDETLDVVLTQMNTLYAPSAYVRKLLSVMEYGEAYTATQLLNLLGFKSKETLRKNYLEPALLAGDIQRTVPDKPTSRNQKYIRR